METIWGLAFFTILGLLLIWWLDKRERKRYERVMSIFKGHNGPFKTNKVYLNVTHLPTGVEKVIPIREANFESPGDFVDAISEYMAEYKGKDWTVGVSLRPLNSH
ncbi:MAG TPA: hypothetical protein VIT44_03025 [Cyclobacteriaceae bacterium]